MNRERREEEKKKKREDEKSGKWKQKRIKNETSGYTNPCEQQLKDHYGAI
jgi:hypothetical protein